MSDTLECPNCGSSVDPSETESAGAHPCPRCGATVPRLEAEIDEPQSGDEDLPSAPTVDAGRCAECGETLGPGERFCPNCGRDLSSPISGPDADWVPRTDRQARQQAKAATRKASRTIMLLAILFAIAGAFLGHASSTQADKVLEAIEDKDADELFPSEVNGKSYTVGELRDEIRIETRLVYITNYGLAVILLGLYFWSRKNPLPAIVTALAVYLVLQVLNAVLDPTTIYQGILIKVIIICVLFGGVRAALTARAAAAREATADPEVA